MFLRRLRSRHKVWRTWSFRNWRKKLIRERKKRIRTRSCCERWQSISVLPSHARYKRVRFSKRACSMSCMFNTAVSAGTASLFYFQTEILTVEVPVSVFLEHSKRIQLLRGSEICVVLWFSISIDIPGHVHSSTFYLNGPRPSASFFCS